MPLVWLRSFLRWFLLTLLPKFLSALLLLTMVMVRWCYSLFPCDCCHCWRFNQSGSALPLPLPVGYAGARCCYCCDDGGGGQKRLAFHVSDLMMGKGGAGAAPLQQLRMQWLPLLLLLRRPRWCRRQWKRSNQDLTAGKEGSKPLRVMRGW